MKHRFAFKEVPVPNIQEGQGMVKLGTVTRTGGWCYRWSIEE